MELLYFEFVLVSICIKYLCSHINIFCLLQNTVMFGIFKKNSEEERHTVKFFVLGLLFFKILTTHYCVTVLELSVCV